MLLADSLEVLVLPHHLGPSTRTAPDDSSCRFSNLSHNLGKYFMFVILLISGAKLLFSFEIRKFLWQLARFYCGSWRIFIAVVGKNGLFQLQF